MTSTRSTIITRLLTHSPTALMMAKGMYLGPHFKNLQSVRAEFAGVASTLTSFRLTHCPADMITAHVQAVSVTAAPSARALSALAGRMLGLEHDMKRRSQEGNGGSMQIAAARLTGKDAIEEYWATVDHNVSALATPQAYHTTGFMAAIGGVMTAWNFITLWSPYNSWDFITSLSACVIFPLLFGPQRLVRLLRPASSQVAQGEQRLAALIENPTRWWFNGSQRYCFMPSATTPEIMDMVNHAPALVLTHKLASRATGHSGLPIAYADELLHANACGEPELIVVLRATADRPQYPAAQPASHSESFGQFANSSA